MALAAVSEFRRLREDLKVSRQQTPDGILHIVKDPEEDQFFKFEEDDYAVIECFRGASSLEDVIARYEASHPGRRLDPDSAREYQATLMEMRLLEQTNVERNLMVMEKIRDARHKKTAGGEGRNIFFMTFPAIDPDRFFDRIHPYIRFFWTPWFVTLSMTGILAMSGIFVLYWDRIARATIEFYNFTNKTVQDIAVILLLMFVIDMMHEFAHGLTCKNFGGEVHEIGFVLFYFTPTFYCDVNDAYLFEKRSHKLWVTFAGAYIELLLCTVATWVWLLSRPDSILGDLCYMTMLYTGLSTIAFNINPLVKLDGYYALMDWLAIPDLRERSFGYVGYLIQSRILRMKAERPVTTRRQRRIFLIYGTLSACYTLAILWLVFGLAWNWLEALLPGWGLPLAMGVVYLLLRKRLRPFAGVLRRLWLEKQEAWMTRRAWLMVSGGAATALALIVLPRFPLVVRSPVILEPERRVFLSTMADGIVTAITAREGDMVHGGDRLAALRNEDLALLVQAIENRRSLAESRARVSRSEGRTAQALQAERETQELAARAKDLQRQLASLEVRAPEDGVVLTPRAEDLLGAYRKAGEPVLELGLTRRMRAVVRVSEWDIRWVAAEQAVWLYLDAFSFRSFRGRVQAVAPAAAEPSERALEELSEETKPHRRFEVNVLLDNPEGMMRPGMAGIAKLYTPPRSVADRVLRFSSDLVRSVFW